jgi:hypothetical protein
MSHAGSVAESAVSFLKIHGDRSGSPSDPMTIGQGFLWHNPTGA